MVENQSEDAKRFARFEEEQADKMLAQAVEAAAKGENTEQLLEVLFTLLPGIGKEKLRKKFATLLAKQNIKPSRADGDITSRGKLTRLFDIFTQSTRQAMERITQLMRSRPDIAAVIAQAGAVFAKHGVVADKVQIGEADLGTMVPLAPAKNQDRGVAGRGN